MKKVFLLLLLIFLCGCTSNYNLKISNNKFEEKIEIVVPNYSYYYEEVIDPETGAVVEDDNQLKSFLDEDTKSLFSKDVNYNKKVKYFDDYAEVHMNYTYSEKEFSDSNSLKLCFDDAIFENSKNYYIHASGRFYCLYSDKLDIVINTKNKVVSNNADRVEGNNYIWTITDDNKGNVDIEFEVEKSSSKIIIIIVYVLVLSIIVFGLIYLIKFAKQKSAINNEI